jgi:hypothetical protein
MIRHYGVKRACVQTDSSKNVLIFQCPVEGFDAGIIGVHFKMLVGLPVERGTDFDVFLREVVGVDQDFADLVGVVGN